MAESIGSRMPVELGQGAAYPSSHGYPLQQSTRGAAHPQNGGAKFTVRDNGESIHNLFTSLDADFEYKGMGEAIRLDKPLKPPECH